MKAFITGKATKPDQSKYWELLFGVAYNKKMKSNERKRAALLMCLYQDETKVANTMLHMVEKTIRVDSIAISLPRS